MKIHEYQGKQIFSRYGIAVPRGIACFSAEAAKSAAEQLIRETANPIVVVKAQIHAGGRGKAGVPQRSPKWPRPSSARS